MTFLGACKAKSKTLMIWYVVAGVVLVVIFLTASASSQEAEAEQTQELLLATSSTSIGGPEPKGKNLKRRDIAKIMTARDAGDITPKEAKMLRGGKQSAIGDFLRNRQREKNGTSKGAASSAAGIAARRAQQQSQQLGVQSGISSPAAAASSTAGRNRNSIARLSLKLP